MYTETFIVTQIHSSEGKISEDRESCDVMNYLLKSFKDTQPN